MPASQSSYPSDAEAIIARIAEASRQFKAGEEIDLADLAEAVRRVAGQADRTDLATVHMLMALQDELQRLGDAIDGQRLRARAKITEIEQARRARRAYRRPR